ncbi:MAG: division/cell wall cluster transcriptional repressor MraZ [Planctomycetota bacterium]
MFYGEYDSKIDDKGRVIIPAKLRDAVPEDELAAGFMMRLGEDGCVTLYTQNRWREVEEAVTRSRQNSRSARRHRRFVFTQAERGHCDKQGRLRIPPRLLDDAGISREVVVLGVSDEIEIWDKSRWDAFKAEMMAEREGDAESYPL